MQPAIPSCAKAQRSRPGARRVPASLITLAPSPYIFVAKDSIQMLLPTEVKVVQMIFRVHIFFHGPSVNTQIMLAEKTPIC